LNHETIGGVGGSRTPKLMKSVRKVDQGDLNGERLCITMTSHWHAGMSLIQGKPKKKHKNLPEGGNRKFPGRLRRMPLRVLDLVRGQ